MRRCFYFICLKDKENREALFKVLPDSILFSFLSNPAPSQGAFYSSAGRFTIIASSSSCSLSITEGQSVIGSLAF